MRSIPAFAMMLALATPLAAAGQSSEPMLGHGIGLPERAVAAREAAAPFAVSLSAGSLRSSGVRLEYGGLRVGGNGFRVSTVADNAFGLRGDETARGLGQAPGGTATTGP